MSFEAFHASTPPEINIKIEAWNSERKREAMRDYTFIVTMATAMNAPKKFPSFERFYPEKDTSGQPVIDRCTAKAMEVAKQLGDI
jgi:hypothetical protein